MPEPETKLILGCGYLGLRVARLWLADGHTVYALTRSPERAARLQATGVVPLVGDVTRPDSLPPFPPASTVLWAVAFQPDSGQSRRAVYVEGLANVLQRLPEGVRRFVHISSTSVYGQDRGEWVDEQSECRPRTESGRVCLEAEQTLWRFFATAGAEGLTATVLRCSGIYGPGRLRRRVAELRARFGLADGLCSRPSAVHPRPDCGSTTDHAAVRTASDAEVAEPGGRRSRRAFDSPPNAWLNLIHVDDAARAVLAAERLAEHGDVFIVSDNRPLTRAEYDQALASHLGLDGVRLERAESERGEVSEHFNKRCLNKKLREKLRFRFLYPDFWAGLPSALQQEA